MSRSKTDRLDWMNSLAFYIVIVSLIGNLSAQTVVPPATTRTVRSTQTDTEPRIDGRLDDAAWAQAVPVDGFLQREPVEGASSSEQTIVRILHDDKRIYISFRCLDSDPDRIVASRMQRDSELHEDDNVSVILDTYNDGRGGFFFRTNPAGAKNDMVLTDEGRSRNEAWDCVWRSRTSRDSLGWSVEMAIDLDQLRYAESKDAVWGINLGRGIVRKNERTYLVPPPQSYGFRGGYRTSLLGRLEGLGELRQKPRLQITPYTLGGTDREFDGLDPTEQPTLNGGVDLKYGLTPSLTLDLSYKTDFAQVEADQEQVNLTRFSLFFPELRDFFLEGASIFDFGETVSVRGRGGGRPPTLVFYSRRIGIQDGNNLPVIFGSKLTGRNQGFQIGALNVMTEAKTFIEENTEKRFVTDTGLLLDGEEAKLTNRLIVDTLDVDVVDSLDVKRTNVSVIRVRRNIFGRSNIGFIATNRGPGEDKDYNRVAGMDVNLSFFDAAVSLKGWLAKSWTQGQSGDDIAGSGEFEIRRGSFEFEASYLDVQKDFNPEVGFVPRDDVRQYKVDARLRPRPKHPKIRQFSLGPEFAYVTDQNDLLQSSEFEFSAYMNLEIGDWIGGRYTRRFERLDESFEVHEDIEIPVGDYTFHGVGFNFFPRNARKVGGRLSYQLGEFFNGTRHRLSSDVSIKVTDRFTVENTYGLNRVSLPAGSFLTNQITSRLLYSFSPDFFVRGLVQWNSARKIVGSNFLLNYRYAPGSDVFLVYNHAWDADSEIKQRNRSVQLKVSYFWKR
ncbi:carbohydrate binding family 9 domain-containing protein [bacterium]|nr:carbohydrate binding family 9 domain-containing protein [bacterium]